MGYIHELVKVEGLPSQNEYLAVQIATVDGLEKDALPEDIPTRGNHQRQNRRYQLYDSADQGRAEILLGSRPESIPVVIYQTAVDDVTAEDCVRQP